MNPYDIPDYFDKVEKPLILDGAMGSLIEQRGYHFDNILWTSLLNLNNPELIIDIHNEYVKAGCDIITTNTFRTNPNSIKLSNKIIDFENFVKQAVNLSKSVAIEQNVLLAGANPPAEDCYQKNRTLTLKELKYNHHSHINSLYTNGVDFILNETQSHWDEIEIISKYCSNLSIPYAISLYFDLELNILSGESVIQVIEMIRNYDPFLICFNCIGHNTFIKFLDSIKIDYNWGFYLNCGETNNLNGNIICNITPQKYIEIVKSSLNLGPKLIGACCGSNPMHIKKINNLFYGKTNS